MCTAGAVTFLIVSPSREKTILFLLLVLLLFEGFDDATQQTEVNLLDRRIPVPN